jgi:hypothetical protein
MTNALAPIGLTYNGTDIQQSTIGIFLEIIRGLNEGPSVRGTDTVVPSLPGRIARNRVRDVIALELEGVVMGSGSVYADQIEDFRGLVNTLHALFDPTAMPADLVASLENGSTATIAARTLNILWDQDTPLSARVNIALEAVEDWDLV